MSQNDYRQFRIFCIKGLPMNPLQLGQQEEIFWCTFPRNSQYDAKWYQNLWCKRTRTNYCLNIYSIKIKFRKKAIYKRSCKKYHKCNINFMFDVLYKIEKEKGDQRIFGKYLIIYLHISKNQSYKSHNNLSYTNLLCIS